MNRSRDKNEDKKMIQVNNVREESGEHVPKVSVIIPFHNAQSHLEEMMDSVEAQTFREIEILCVSDGSEDDSIKIIRERMEKDPRIYLIEQEKHNAGVARNKGLECAVGKYVVFWMQMTGFIQKHWRNCITNPSRCRQTSVSVKCVNFAGTANYMKQADICKKINCRRKIHLINMTYQGISLDLHRTCCGIKCFAERSLWKMRLHSRISGREMILHLSCRQCIMQSGLQRSVKSLLIIE